jgi:NADH-quinone oxidoreductase subunit N
MTFVAPDVNYYSMLPFITVLLTAVFATILPFYVSRKAIAGLSAVGLLIALVESIALWNTNLSSFYGAYRADNFALGFSIVLIVGALIAIISSVDVAKRGGTMQAEFFAILLYAVSGTMLLASAHDLIVLLIGFEVMSLGVYVLSSFQETSKSEEAGMKYFLLGGFASAILIFGIALVFGATGKFGLEAINTAVLSPEFKNSSIAAVGALFILIGFGFKVAMAPFHQWTPDVYTGAPTVVTQFMSVAVKAAAFAGFLHIFGLALQNVPGWQTPLQFLIALTLMIGNLAALRQSNLKRMLAYSSVAHAGYVGLAVLGFSSALYYLGIYTLMNAGAFAVLNVLSKDDDGLEIESLAGLGSSKPLLAATLTFFLLSLAGIPPLGGFIGKYLIFSAAASSGYYGLVILAAITSAVSLAYYLRPIGLMYFRPRVTVLPDFSGRSTRVLLVVCAAGVLILGLVPNAVYGLLELVKK